MEMPLTRQAIIALHFCFSLTLSIKRLQGLVAVLLGGKFHLTSYHRVSFRTQFCLVAALPYPIRGLRGGGGVARR